MNTNIKTTLKIRLSEYLFNSTKTDTNYMICKTMLDRIEQFPDINIEQIAYLANVTPSSVTKFFKKIGYAGFQDIKKHSFMNVSSAVTDTEDFYHASIDEMHAFYRRMYESYDQSRIQEVGQLLVQAEKVCVISGIHGFAAANLFEELLRPYDMIVYEVNRDAEDAVIEDMMQASDLTIVLSLTGAWIEERLSALLQNNSADKEHIYVLTENDALSDSVLDQDHIILFPGKKEEYHSNLLTSAAEQAFFLLLAEYLIQHRKA